MTPEEFKSKLVIDIALCVYNIKIGDMRDALEAFVLAAKNDSLSPEYYNDEIEKAEKALNSEGHSHIEFGKSLKEAIPYIQGEGRESWQNRIIAAINKGKDLDYLL